MRTIKFRGKRCCDGEWVFGYYLESHSTWKGCKAHKAWILTDAMTNGGFFSLLGRNAVIDETVGQFTGLLDKSGAPIYEGDIVRFCMADANFVGLVEFDNVNPCMCISYRNQFNFIDVEYDFVKAGLMIIEVIGNIHDNPKLLENEKD